MKTTSFYICSVLLSALLGISCSQQKTMVNKEEGDKPVKNTTVNVQQMTTEADGEKQEKSSHSVFSDRIVHVADKVNNEGDYVVGMLAHAAAFHVSEKAENCNEILEALRYGVKQRIPMLMTVERVQKGRSTKAYIVSASKLKE